MSKFADALDRKAEEIVAPPNMPLGHYIFQISKVPAHKEINDEWESVEIIAVCVEATDDVDEDDLSAYGVVAGTAVRKSFMFAIADDKTIEFERSLNNLKMFLGNAGVDVNEGTMKEWLPDSVNGQFMGELLHRPDKNDPDVVYQEIGRTAPVE